MDIFKTTATLTILLISQSAFAFGEESKSEETNNSIYFFGFSKHIFTEDLNETHYLLAYERNDILVGAFINSYDDWTGVFAYDFDYNMSDYLEFDFAQQIDFGIMIGASYGYNCEDLEPLPCYNKISPVAMPYISYTYKEYPIKPVFALLGEALFFTMRMDF